jgi:hypothetical protein
MLQKTPAKIECLNPHTGRKMKIDSTTYELFSKAIHHTLGRKKSLTYTEIATGVKKYLKEKEIVFKGSIEWYAITVKNDLEANGMIETFTEKGKKLNRLKK